MLYCHYCRGKYPRRHFLNNKLEDYDYCVQQRDDDETQALLKSARSAQREAKRHRLTFLQALSLRGETTTEEEREMKMLLDYFIEEMEARADLLKDDPETEVEP